MSEPPPCSRPDNRRTASSIPRLVELLDDKEPQVAVAAASTLWKMGDHSGEDILMAVADGERKASAGLIDSARHTVTTDLHNPSTIARIGALQGASLLLGPFGFGITAYEYIHKNGGQSARPLAIELLSQEKSKAVHDELVSALADKDLGVRAARCQGARRLPRQGHRRGHRRRLLRSQAARPPYRGGGISSRLRCRSGIASRRSLHKKEAIERLSPRSVNFGPAVRYRLLQVQYAAPSV